MERNILHFDVASFAIAVERVVTPSLRGRPIVLARNQAERAIVLSASPEARAEGVGKGMQIRQAAKRCRSLVVLPPNEPLYARAMRATTEMLLRFSPLVEPAAPGHLFVDMTGTGRLFGPAKDAATKIRREIASRLRLEPTVGIAANKLVSRVAAKVIQPTGAALCDVFRGGEAAFLAPLDVCALPGVGREREARLLGELNVRIVKELAAVPVADLTLVFGRVAVALHLRAGGIDGSPVRPPERKPSFVEEAPLASETNDDALLAAVLYALVERAACRMRKQSAAAAGAEVSLRYADGVGASRKARIAPTNLDTPLFAHVEALFRKACARRTRVRHLSVRFFDLVACKNAALGLVGGARQLELFSPDAACAVENTPARIAAALDAIRERFGAEAIRLGRTLAPSFPDI